jgi:RecB family endonuclease NucS
MINAVLQVNLDFSIIVTMFFTLIISLTFFLILRKMIIKNSNKTHPIYESKLNDFQNKFDTFLLESPPTEQIKILKEEFEKLKIDTNQTHDINNKTTLDHVENKVKQELEDLRNKLKEFVDTSISENVVNKTEFDSLKDRIDDILGNDENKKRIQILYELFDSDKVRTITWKCDLLHLMKDGFAPKIQADLLHSKNIPKSYTGFLKKLSEKNVIEITNVDAYSINEDQWWIYEYIKNPYQLQSQFENVVIKEKQYQNFIHENLEKIELNLKLIQAEYKLTTGPIDFLCVDKDGKDVGLELKFPKAQNKDVRQLSGYIEEYTKKTSKENVRGILISPTIPDTVKKTLEEYNLEWAEISFDSNDFKKNTIDQNIENIDNVETIDNSDVSINENILHEDSFDNTYSSKDDNSDDKNLEKQYTKEEISEISVRYLQLRKNEFSKIETIIILSREFTTFVKNDIEKIFD